MTCPLSSVATVKYSVHWSLFTRNHKNTAMFNWSPCMLPSCSNMGFTVFREDVKNPHSPSLTLELSSLINKETAGSVTGILLLANSRVYIPIFRGLWGFFSLRSFMYIKKKCCRGHMNFRKKTFLSKIRGLNTAAAAAWGYFLPPPLGRHGLDTFVIILYKELRSWHSHVLGFCTIQIAQEWECKSLQ